MQWWVWHKELHGLTRAVLPTLINLFKLLTVLDCARRDKTGNVRQKQVLSTVIIS